MRVKIALTVVVSAAALATGGCTSHLESVRITDASAPAAARRGAPYMLQFTQYTIVLTGRVVECARELKTTIKAEVTPQTVDDGDFVYVIPSNSLISPMKVTELKVEWTNGRLTAVNASAEDRTAQTILAATQGIAKIAKTVITGGVVGAGGATEGCSDEVLAALKASREAKADITKHETAITRLTPEVTRLKAGFVAAGDEKTRQLLIAAVNRVDAANILLEDARERLKKALEFLSYKQTVTWPQRSLELATPADKPLEVPLTIFKKWYDMPTRTGESDQDHKERRDARYKTFADKMRVWFVLERIGSYGRVPGDGVAPDNGSARDGLRFRLPANGNLLVCQGSPCSSTDTDKVVTATPGPVLQLGLIFFAQFSSPPFTGGSFAATFDDLGRPKTMAFGRKSSSAETIAGLVKDAGGEAASLYAALNKTSAERAAEKLADLEAQKKLADARAALDPTSPAKVLAAIEMEKKIADARLALEPSPTYELARLSAIAKAQREYQNAIDALKLDPNADAVAQSAAFEADAALLRSEAASIEARIQVRDARQRLGQ